MRKQVIAYFILCLGICVAFGEVPPETLEQFQEQKRLAALRVVPISAGGFSTPLQVGEAYFSSLTRLDSSEFQYLTKRAIQSLFNQDSLSQADLQRMRDADEKSGIGEYKLVGFWYLDDVVHPKVVLGITCAFQSFNRAKVIRFERISLTLVATASGWMVDGVESP
jgi:hypothetical protein